jgi:nicotinamidase-related amidase
MSNLLTEKTAVLCMEMQQGVLAADGPFPQLRAAVLEANMIECGAALLTTARSQHIPVIHCTAAFRSDRSGTPVNTALLAKLLKNPAHMLEGSPAVDVIAEWLDEDDLENRRYHGFSPFTATDLHSQLSAMQVKTLIVTGVSLNIGVTGLCIEAVNLGYKVIVASDAVAGFPKDYADALLRNTLSGITQIVPCAEIINFLESIQS